MMNQVLTVHYIRVHTFEIHLIHVQINSRITSLMCIIHSGTHLRTNRFIVYSFVTHSSLVRETVHTSTTRDSPDTFSMIHSRFSSIILPSCFTLLFTETISFHSDLCRSLTIRSLTINDIKTQSNGVV